MCIISLTEIFLKQYLLKVGTGPVLNHLLSLFPNLILIDQEEDEINRKHSLNNSKYYRANFPYTHFGKLSGLK